MFKCNITNCVSLIEIYLLKKFIFVSVLCVVFYGNTQGEEYILLSFLIQLM